MAVDQQQPFQIDPREVVSTSQKLWSEIVESVDPEAGDDNPVVYPWSNGRCFRERPQ